MKKVLVLLTFIILVSHIFSLNVGLLGGIELGGRERIYLGARSGILAFPIGLLVDVFLPFNPFNLENETNNGEMGSNDNLMKIQSNNILDSNFLEINPFLLLSIPFNNLFIYSGAAPIIIFDIEQLGFSFYGEWVKLKAGLQYGESFIVFLEGMTAMNFDFQFSGVFSIHAGFGIRF